MLKNLKIRAFILLLHGGKLHLQEVKIEGYAVVLCT